MKAALVRVVRPLAFLGASALLLAAAWAVNLNEGRTDPARLGSPAIAIPAEQNPPFRSQGRLVAVTGAVAAEPVGDGMFLKPGPWLAVRRDFEVFGWMEREGRDVTVGPDGREVEVPRHDYSLEWSVNPHDSEAFRVQAGHENPPLHIEKRTYFAPSARIGQYEFDAERLALSILTPLPLLPEMLDLEERGRLVGDYVYYKDADPANPKPGDVRVFFSVLPVVPEMTVTGELRGRKVVPSGGIFRLESGGNHDALVVAIAAFQRNRWLWRAAIVPALLAAFWLVLAARPPRRKGVASALGRPLAVLVLSVATLTAALGLDGQAATAAAFVPALAAIMWAGRRPAATNDQR